jgi:AcrR family transcriptional regulator
VHKASDPKAPRKRSSAETKARILRAARTAFANAVYSAVGVREIAAAAGVNTNLITRYFGSKAGLFEAALTTAIDVPAWSEIPREAFAERMLESIMAQDLEGNGMVVKSIGDPIIKHVISKVTSELIVPPLVEFLGPPNAEERALNVMILSSGYFHATRVASAEPGDNPYTRDWLVRTLQEIVMDSGN